jgi:hypothetical protein
MLAVKIAASHRLVKDIQASAHAWRQASSAPAGLCASPNAHIGSLALAPASLLPDRRNGVSVNFLYGFERFNLQNVQSGSFERPAKVIFFKERQ